MISCDPNSLAQAAKCFQCIPHGFIATVKSYLLCQIASGGGGAVTPGAPSNIDINANASTEAGTIITWTNNAPAGTTNEIWRSVNGGAYALLGSVGGGVATFTDVAAVWANGDVRQYKVRACNGATCSAFTTDVAAGFRVGTLGLVNYTYPTMIVHYHELDTAASGVALTATFTKLRVVQGSVVFAGEALTAIDFAALVTVQGDLNFSSNPALLNASLPSLVSLTGNFDFDNDSALLTCTAPNLAGTIGSVVMNNCTALTTFSLDLVTQSAGVDGNFSTMVLFSMAALTTVTPGSVTIHTSPVVTINLPNLVSVNGDLFMNTDGGLTTLTVTSLQTVGGGIDISLDTALTAINFPALTDINGADFICTNCTAATTLTLTNLATVAQNILFSGCTSLLSADFPALASMGATFNGQNCTSLTQLTFGGVVNFPEAVIMDGCTALATVSMPNVLWQDNGFTTIFDNCQVTTGNSAAGTGIDGILRRSVVSGLTLQNIQLNNGPNQAPSASGVADRITLQGAGCTVVTN